MKQLSVFRTDIWVVAAGTRTPLSPITLIAELSGSSMFAPEACTICVVAGPTMAESSLVIDASASVPHGTACSPIVVRIFLVLDSNYLKPLPR